MNVHRSAARCWLRSIAIAVLVGASAVTAAVPDAVAAPTASICVQPTDACIHRTTVDSGSTIQLKAWFHVGISKWEWRHGYVWLHMVGGAPGFELFAHVRTFNEQPILQFHTDVEGPATYVFRMQMKWELTDRAIVTVNAP
jgi:hypothetical protein